MAKETGAVSASVETQSAATANDTVEGDAKHGKVAIINPERSATSVAFPNSEGGHDIYEDGQRYKVPAAHLNVKDVDGKPYLVEYKD